MNDRARAALRGLVGAAAFLLATHTLHAERFIVEFRDEASPQLASTTHERFRADLAAIEPQFAKAPHGAIRREFTRLFRGAAVELQSRASIRRLMALPYVANVHRDREVTTGETPRAIAGSHREVGGMSGGAGVTVAVLDTGIDYNHPAFGGGFGPGKRIAGGYDFVNGDSDPMDDNRHGTHVAGIIAARSAAVTGISPDVTLLAYKVLDANGKGEESNVIAALERAVDPNGDGDFSDRADVINLSLGSPGHPDDPLAKAVDRATSLGAVVVASVGNSGEEHAINSPALARTAIAVGAIDGGSVLAEFSARGPAPMTDAVRPHVLAPGVLIKSTVPGGGTLALSGTSMAAPYVAGLAARIVEQHPGWSPERVRSAIAASGYPLPHTDVMAQGSGRVDVPAALASSVFIDTDALGFGVIDRTQAAWRSRRAIRLRSEYDVPVTLRAEARQLPEGVGMTFSPAEVILNPGVEREISVDLEVDVAKIDATQSGLAIGGWVVVSRGAEDVHVPWSFLRAARVRVSSDTEFPELVWSRNGTARGSIAVLDPYTIESLLEPAEYDLAAVSVSLADVSVVVHERLRIDGTRVLDIRNEDATHEIRWAAADPAGGLLRHDSSESHFYAVAGRLLFADGARKWSIELPPGFETLRSSSFGDRWSLLITETSVDTAARRIVVAQHPPLSPLEADRVLVVDASRYTSQPIALTFPGDARERNLWILPRGMTRRLFETGRRPTGMGVGNVEAEWNGTVWLSPEVHPDYASGVQIGLYTEDPRMNGTSSIITPMIRNRDGAVFSARDYDPAPLAIGAAADETIRWGAGMIWPSVRIAAQQSEGMRSWSGSVDVVGDRFDMRRRETAKAAWRVVSEAGAPLASGTFGLGGLVVPAVAGHRLEVLVASPETRLFDASTATLAIEMANGDDPTPPTLTSLALLDANGRHQRRLARGAGGTLVLSAADYEYTPDGPLYRKIAEGQTSVAFRRPGDVAWIDLPARVVREDEGNDGRAGAGFVYEADVSALAAVAGAVELRIVVTDPAGNKSTWTLAPAFRIDASGRERPVRR